MAKVILSDRPWFRAKLEKFFENAEVITTAIVSAGSSITIPAGSTVAEALKILADKIDPGGGGA